MINKHMGESRIELPIDCGATEREKGVAVVAERKIDLKKWFYLIGRWHESLWLLTVYYELVLDSNRSHSKPQKQKLGFEFWINF